jgi:uncharacterized protein YndB with AHSA1/START domain
MKRAFRVEETIPATPEAVWSVMTDWQRAGRWMGSVEVTDAAAAAAARVGDRIVFTSRGKRVESRITAWDPPRRLVLESTQGGLTARYDYRIEPSGDACILRLEATCGTSHVGWAILSPLVRTAMKRADSGQLRSLRELVMEMT